MPTPIPYSILDTVRSINDIILSGAVTNEKNIPADHLAFSDNQVIQKYPVWCIRYAIQIDDQRLSSLIRSPFQMIKEEQ